MSLKTAATTTTTTVITTIGKITGLTLQNLTSKFLGIPFALPPIGSLRFKTPVPVTHYSSPINATSFAAASLQPIVGIGLTNVQTTSEDCLYLNIWRPRGPGPFPVLFYVYGGANIGGSTSGPSVDGSNFANSGIICVTAGYRVGAAGFLELGKLLGDEYKESANNGIRDLVCALEWVHKHIGAFGGDMNNLTLSGTSAGGKNVCSMLATTRVANIPVHNVILNSGGWFTSSFQEAEKVADVLFQRSGLKDPKELLTISSEELLRIQGSLVAAIPSGSFCFRAVHGGKQMPETPYDVINSGKLKHIKNWLITTCRDENALFLIMGNVQPEQACPTQILHNMSSAEYAILERKYDGIKPNLSPAERRILSLTAVEYWIPSVRIAEALTEQKDNVYMTRMDRGMPSGKMKGLAVHASDLGFYFGHAGTWQPGITKPSSENLHFAKRMHEVWCKFVKEGTCPWGVYGKERRVMILDSERFTLANDPSVDERVLFDGWVPGMEPVGRNEKSRL